MKLRVETSQLIGRPVDEVFEAWVDPRKMAGYFISSGSALMEAGKTVVWSWDVYGETGFDIRVETVEPGRRLVFNWSPSDIEGRVEVEFEAETANTTRVTVREGEWESDAAGIERYAEQKGGWVHMLLCLKAYLEHDGINLRQTKASRAGSGRSG